MKDVWRVSLRQFLAVIGLVLVLSIPPLLPVETLSLIEPVLIVILIIVWFSGYYVKASLVRRGGFTMATPTFRRHLPGHLGIADILHFLVIAAGILFVWIFWSAQPTRIFNMTILGITWEFVMMTDFLLHFRHPDPTLQTGPPRIARD